MTAQQGGKPDPEQDPGEDDATRVVPRPETAPAPAPAPAEPAEDDATRVVARPAAVADAPAEDDATRAVQRRLAEPVEDDATRAVPRPAVAEDATRVVPRRGTGGGAGAGNAAAPGRERILKPAVPDQTGSGAAHTTSRTGSTTGSRNPAPPVEEPQVTNISRDAAALMFKSPLDPRRRVRNSSVSGAEGAEPRQGVSRGIPVVYGPRAPEALKIGVAAAPSAPAATAEIPPAAVRDGLPSTARINRRERLVTLVGGGVLVAASIAGLWWISLAAFG